MWNWIKDHKWWVAGGVGLLLWLATRGGSEDAPKGGDSQPWDYGLGTDALGGYGGLGQGLIGYGGGTGASLDSNDYYDQYTKKAARVVGLKNTVKALRQKLRDERKKPKGGGSDDADGLSVQAKIVAAQTRIANLRLKRTPKNKTRINERIATIRARIKTLRGKPTGGNEDAA